MLWSSTAAWAGALAALSLSPQDLALRPERWPTRATLPIVEGALRDPLSAPASVDRLERSVREAESGSGLLQAGAESLGVKIETVALPKSGVKVPKRVPEPVGLLVAQLGAAKKRLKRALKPMRGETRERALRAARAAVGDDALLEPRAEDFDAAERFDLPGLAAAGLMAARAVERAIPELEKAKGGLPAKFSARWDTALGPVLVSSGDAELGPKELASHALIVRLGGRTRYRGPAAAAREGELRVVIDLGGPVVLRSSGPAAGSGTLGIGLFYLRGEGPHEIQAGEDSLGAGRLGVGVASIAGAGSRLESRAFGQGAAVYGFGVLDTSGDGASLRLPLAGQGFGSTEGAGVWRHRGDGLTAACGFERPDPREPLGFQSLGQGAGMGPRAFAAGGVGAAHLSGRGARLTAGYFAQGSGYWRGLGALFVRGDEAFLQSRRYGMGTGVHSAVGALDVQGERAELRAWGVGPGFGWDQALGLFRLRGGGAKLRSDWANGRADVGGRALAWLEGEGLELALHGFGTGSFSRGLLGQGLAVIRGEGRLRAPGLAAPVSGPFLLRSTPWGAIDAQGALRLDPALALPEPEWPVPDRQAQAAKEAPGVRRLMSEEGASPAARVRRLLLAASAQVMDARPAQGAALGLAGLPEDHARALAAALDPERFNELVWARLAAAGLGPGIAAAALAEAEKAKDLRRLMLLDWARYGGAAAALPVAEALLKEKDWRARRAGAGLLAGLWSGDGGDEPGRLRLLADAAEGRATPERQGIKRLGELYAALSLAGTPSAEERAALLAAAGTPFDNAQPQAKALFASLVSSSPARVEALRRELADAERLRPRAAALLRAAAKDPDQEVSAAALWGLGGLGDPADVAPLADALDSPSALRRESAAQGLGRMGEAGRAAIESALSSPRARVRAMAALAAAQSFDEPTFLLLVLPLFDADASVRAAAVAGLGGAQAVMSAAKESLLPELRRLAESDPDPGVKASAALAAAAIKPAG